MRKFLLKKTYRLLVICIVIVLCSGCFASRNGTLKRVKENRLKRAMWVWDAGVITDKEKQKNFFAFCLKKSITRAFVDVGDCFIETKSAEHKNPYKKVPVSKTALAEFVRAAHKHNLKIEALDGAPSWAYAEQHHIAILRLKRALEFNQEVSPESRLDGWQCDCEPYLLKEFKTENWERVLSEYLSLVAQLCDLVREMQPDFALGFALPFWLDSEAPNLSYMEKNGQTKPITYHLIDQLDAVKNGYVAIMSYRDFAKGPDGSIEHVRDEVNYVEKNTKHVGIFIGQETAAADPEKVSFHEEGEDALEKAIAAIVAEFGNSPHFRGIAIHHYESYRKMVQKLAKDEFCKNR